MSAELVKQSLELVDVDFSKKQKGKKKKKQTSTINSIYNKGKRLNIPLTTTKKLTITEAKKSYKSREEKLKENLKKLQLIKDSCNIELDNTMTKQIIMRGRTGKAVKIKTKSKKKEKTAFTEEDFEKFEQEYVN